MTDNPTGAHKSTADRDDQTNNSGRNDSSQSRTPEGIEADLQQTRDELSETVNALSAKLDVNSRARDQLSATKHRVED